MASFDARLRVPGQARLPLNVVVEVDGDRIAFTSGDKPLGDWLLSTVVADVRSDGFHLIFDNEEIVLTVTDPAGFARALGIGARRSVPPTSKALGNGGGEAMLVESNGSRSRNVLSSRLQGMTPEERFADVIDRVSELRTALTDDSVPPQEVFARWLRLLKDINQRHGQGVLPTPLFYKLNTELLELMPAPSSRPQQHEPVAVGITA